MANLFHVRPRAAAIHVNGLMGPEDKKKRVCRNNVPSSMGRQPGSYKGTTARLALLLQHTQLTRLVIRNPAWQVYIY